MSVIVKSRDKYSITLDDPGASESMYLPAGLWALSIAFESTGEATLQAAPPTIESWKDVNDENGDVITVTDGGWWIVEGGLRYRLNVDTVDDPITIAAERLNQGSM